jgi:hypothetical protein
MYPKLLCAALVAVSASRALAQDPPPAASPNRTLPAAPPSELQALAVFAGAWKCEGTILGATDAPPQKTRATLTVAPDLDGFWLSGRQVREKTSGEARPRTRQFYWAFDSAMRQYVGGWLDSRGDWLTHTSRGWDGDKLVFVGHIMTGPARRAARETFTRPADSGFTRSFEVLNELTWTRVAEETCRKR